MSFGAVSHILPHLKNVLMGCEADLCMTVVFQTFFTALVMPSPEFLSFPTCKVKILMFGTLASQSAAGKSQLTWMSEATGISRMAILERDFSGPW